MCYKKPGPRCSGHTRAALLKAKERLLKAESTGDASQIQSAKTTHQEAMFAYCTSPEGLAGLKNKISQTHVGTLIHQEYSSLYNKAFSERQRSIQEYEKEFGQKPTGDNMHPSLAKVTSLANKAADGLERGIDSALGLSSGTPTRRSRALDGMGRGLDALLGVSSKTQQENKVEDQTSRQLNEFTKEVQEHSYARSAFREAEATLVLDGTVALSSDEENHYYTHPFLKNSKPDLRGWKPKNDTAKYVMNELVGAALDQKEAGFENAGLDTTVEDLAKKRIPGLRFKSTFNWEQPTHVGEYDQGWLYSYHQGVEIAKEFPFIDGSEATQKREFLRFATLRRYGAKMKLEDSNNEFNAGAYEAWNTIVESLNGSKGAKSGKSGGQVIDLG